MNDVIWRIFQVNLQIENNSSNWLGFALFSKWMMWFDEFFKWIYNLQITRQINLFEEISFADGWGIVMMLKMPQVYSINQISNDKDF